MAQGKGGRREKKVLLCHSKEFILIVKLWNSNWESRARAESDKGTERLWNHALHKRVHKEKDRPLSAAESSHLHHNADGVYRSISEQLRLLASFIALHLFDECESATWERRLTNTWMQLGFKSGLDTGFVNKNLGVNRDCLM
jgi:hypothetical protein